MSLGSDHKHIPDYSLCCHLNPGSFLLRYKCPVLAHMYIMCIYVYTRAIHKQSITVTIIAFSLFFSAVLIPVQIFLFVLQEPKREGDAILHTWCRFRRLRTF